MQRLFTGLQPSGALHLGNYFGVLKPLVKMFTDHTGLVMVADYHALTSLKDGPRLRQYTIDVVKDYLAVGVDPTKATIFQQSQVQEHTELAWVFECLISVSTLELSHAYKDKVAKGLEANAGLFNYPLLMAADILLYDTDIVPVGADQRQHVEYAREAAAKFNNAFGQTFKEPKELINDEIAVIPGTDGKKMSKSYGNTIPLFGSKDEIAKAVMSIVTDSSGDVPTNVHAIHKHFRDATSLETLYAEKKGRYKDLKDALIAPMRERRNSITDADVVKVLKDGSDKARVQAAETMKDVRTKIGIAL